MIHFRCPRCGEELVVPDSLVGKRQTCPACGLRETVPNLPSVPDKEKKGLLSSLARRLGKGRGKKR